MPPEAEAHKQQADGQQSHGVREGVRGQGFGSSSRYNVPPAAPYRKAIPKSRKPLEKDPG